MRLVGIVLVLAGFALAFGYPLYQADYSGEKLTTLNLYDRERDGWKSEWQVTTVELSEADNPVRIRLEGKRAAADSFIGSTIPVSIEVEGPEGLVLSAGLDLRLASDSQGGTNSIDQRLYINAPDFDVLVPGTHEIRTATSIERDISIMSMDAVVMTRVKRPANEYLQPGLIMAGIGAALFVVGNRRSRKRVERAKSHGQGAGGQSGQPNATKSRWGRQ